MCNYFVPSSCSEPEKDADDTQDGAYQCVPLNGHDNYSTPIVQKTYLTQEKIQSLPALSTLIEFLEYVTAFAHTVHGEMHHHQVTKKINVEIADIHNKEAFNAYSITSQDDSRCCNVRV